MNSNVDFVIRYLLCLLEHFLKQILRNVKILTINVKYLSMEFHILESPGEFYSSNVKIRDKQSVTLDLNFSEFISIPFSLISLLFQVKKVEIREIMFSCSQDLHKKFRICGILLLIYKYELIFLIYEHIRYRSMLK